MRVVNRILTKPTCPLFLSGLMFDNDDSLPFDYRTGRLCEEILSEDDKLFQELWRTYFKAICIKERINPKKLLNDILENTGNI